MVIFCCRPDGTAYTEQETTSLTSLIKNFAAPCLRLAGAGKTLRHQKKLSFTAAELKVFAAVLFTEADWEIGCEAFAGGIYTRNLQNGGFKGGFFQRQRKQICPQEILPVLVVNNGLC